MRGVGIAVVLLLTTWPAMADQCDDLLKEINAQQQELSDRLHQGNYAPPCDKELRNISAVDELFGVEKWARRVCGNDPRFRNRSLDYLHTLKSAFISFNLGCRALHGSNR